MTIIQQKTCRFVHFRTVSDSSGGVMVQQTVARAPGSSSMNQRFPVPSREDGRISSSTGYDPLQKNIRGPILSAMVAAVGGAEIPARTIITPLNDSSAHSTQSTGKRKMESAWA